MAGGRIAAARPRAAASFIRAKPERAQHVALPAPGQVVALGARQRLPLFARQPARIVAFRHGAAPFIVPVTLRCERSEPRRATAPAPRPYPSRAAARPPQDDGEQASLLVLATQLRPSFADRSHQAFASKKIRGGGAPKRRNCPVGPRHASDVAIQMRFGRGRALIGARSPRPCAEARSRPRFTRCSAQALPAPWHCA